MGAAAKHFGKSVFINCPFDDAYWPIFEAIVFSVIACGFRPRCSLEELDSGTIRLNKIRNIIRSCRYGIHDLSRVEVNAKSKLPRFNMPFELGLDIAARTFGTGSLKRKRFLVLDARKYRYQALISDLSGQDIQRHNNSPDSAINVVRKWLRLAAGSKSVPGPTPIKREFAQFAANLPAYCKELGLDRGDLLFVEYVELATQWLEAADL